MSEQKFINTNTKSWHNLEQFPGTQILSFAKPVPEGSIHRAFIREKQCDPASPLGARERASRQQAQLLVLDEPTAALEPHSEYEIYNRFSKLVKGKTAILGKSQTVNFIDFQQY